jgi:GAF domain-containing protein
MGLLFADNKFTRAPITPQDLELLSIFADLLALALRNHSEFGEFAQAMVQIEQLNRTILDLTPSQDPESFLADAVEQICLNGSAAGAALILVDDGSLTVQKVICAGTERATIPVAIRPDGISVEAMRTGSPVAIQDRAAERDRLNPETLQNNYVSSLCLPVRYHGRVAGVLWVHYTEMQPFNEGKRSTEQTLAALRIYADHALLVYHNACRIQQQQDLIKAAEEISNERTVVDVCRRAVHCADGLFGADFCTFWPYDSVLDRFESEHAASTIQEKVDPSVKLREPRPGGATFLVLRAKYLEVESVEPKSAFGMSSKPYGIKSFQAVLVEVGSEPVGAGRCLVCELPQPPFVQ